MICCLHSKSARRKKREEAQKLPEVSKEIYYDVSGNLKTVFGPTKSDVTGQEEKTSWDQEEEEEVGGQDEEPTLLSSVLLADYSAGKEESSGFKFSFFGDETETDNKETGGWNLMYLSQSVWGGWFFFSKLRKISLCLAAKYKVESIQAPKVSWQQDPRFNDSSSDEDEEEQEEDEEQTSTATKIREWEKSRYIFVNCLVSLCVSLHVLLLLVVVLLSLLLLKKTELGINPVYFYTPG